VERYIFLIFRVLIQFLQDSIFFFHALPLPWMIYISSGIYKAGMKMFEAHPQFVFEITHNWKISILPVFILAINILTQ
jgi:hypothetical protein